MLEYKDERFFSDFFSSQEGLTLVKEFELSDKDKNKTKLYIGEFEFKDTIHSIKVRAEIPVNFPHGKLMFYTSSLYGYPHLIECIGNKDKESWFCLNSPFAETAEAQLEIELSRLRGWIEKNVRENLPAIIEDSQVIASLRRISAYSWENPDEIAELHNDAVVTFVGDFAKDAKNFTATKGSFNCVKNGSNRFFVLKDKGLCNATIPYIIVDEKPSVDKLRDFVALRDFYKWDDETCEFLLPNFDSQSKEYKISDVSNGSYINNIFKKIRERHGGNITGAQEDIKKKEKLTVDEAYACLSKAETELTCPECFLPIIHQEVESIKAQIEKENGFSIFSDILSYTSKYDRKPDESEEDYEERKMQLQWEEEYYIEVYPYILSYFFLGLRNEDGTIFWMLLKTNRHAAKSDEHRFDLALKTIRIEKLSSWSVWVDIPIYITEQHFFGRGSFGSSLCDKKIALIGIGAIGSQLAESLVRSGVKHLGLWDNDAIECGNICRSTYNIKDLGEAKVLALKEHLHRISPKAIIQTNGDWDEDKELNTLRTYRNGDLYGNINYDSQEQVSKKLAEYDLIIDCTASNELLHFLSYAIVDKPVISLCITNHSDNLVLVSSQDGNAYEIRKAFLSKLVQDTKNFYHEGSGCYSPTFLALNCDIASLVNLAVREINATIGNSKPLHSTIWSHSNRGVVADRLRSYKLKDYDISLIVSSETLLDGEDTEDVKSSTLGYLFGCYSADGKTIMLTHIVEASSANSQLADAYETSNGIIDYIGDFCYAFNEDGDTSDDVKVLLQDKADNPNINTNNPLLAVRTPSGNIKFSLLINGELVPFEM